MPRAARAARSPRPRWLVVPALGMALLAAFGWQVWRGIDLEREARARELANATDIAAAILREATRSQAVFDSLPAAGRMVADDEGIRPDSDLGWLRIDPSPLDDDPVVAYRLERAAQAEFAAGDPQRACREFDELLAGNLLVGPRLRSLAAAAWQSHRAGDAGRTAAMHDAAAPLLATLAPADLARPMLAEAVAALLRLPGDRMRPWQTKLVPWLPADLLVGIDDTAEIVAARTRDARRSQLRHLDDAWRAQQVRADESTLIAHGEQLVWAFPDQGRHLVRLLAARDLVAAARRAGELGVLPRWPWLIEVEFGPEMQGVAGIPGLASLGPAGGALPMWSVWLWPVATAALLLAFAASVVAQLRATARETEALATQADFLTGVTHELKTPLAAIRLLAEMLSEGRARGREAEYHAMLVGETARLSTLIDGVLDLGRAERGERTLTIEGFDAAAVLRETVAMLTPLTAQEGTTLRVELPTLPLTRGDRDVLAQALVAVLDNARKYAPGTIDVAARICAGTIDLVIRDHGPGVPADERERIFERFVRGQAQRSGQVPGVGVGLYLARTLLRRCGGDLRCEAAATGTGAAFVLTLPREAAA
ncbi:MAG: hypothetical protein RL398_1364 [Planctomycetota bacterium]